MADHCWHALERDDKDNSEQDICCHCGEESTRFFKQVPVFEHGPWIFEWEQYKHRFDVPPECRPEDPPN